MRKNITKNSECLPCLISKFKTFFIVFFLSLSLPCAALSPEQPLTIQKILETPTQAEIAAPGLTDSERDWLKSHPSISVGVNHGYMPIEFLSEGYQFRGISMDYLAHLERLLGVHFKKFDLSDNPDINTLDMVSASPNTKPLEKIGFVSLDKPYLTFAYAIYTHTNNTEILNLKDLEGKRVAVFVKGAIINQLVKDIPSIQLVKVDLSEDAFIALEQETVDAYIGNEVIVDYIANFQGLTFVKKVKKTPYQAKISMAVRKDWPELKSILEKSLKSLESERPKILKKWDLLNSKKNEQVLYIALGFAFTLLSLSLYKAYRLKLAIEAQKKLSQERIWHQANFDFLTNLPNRMMFQNRLQEEIKKSARSKLPLAILFIDLDAFKEINDQLGHATGDELIKHVANRISECVRSIDTTARLGGDEFTVIMGELTDLNSIEKTCLKILKRLQEPFHIEHHNIYVTASIGISVYPNDTDKIEDLIVFADQAMYEAKNLGRNRYQFFTASMQEAATNRHTITNDLRIALLEKHLVVHYQPIVNLNAPTLPTKAEALVRWKHPTKGLISPLEFISIAEETRLIEPLGDWVFEQVLKDLKVLRETTRNPDFQISINVSPRQFIDEENLLSWIARMNKEGIRGNSIAVEITEGLLLEASPSVKHILSEFIKAGTEVSIDDFGTGYSALGYLQKFDVDYLKLDKSFVQNLAPENDNAVLCEAIIGMAHKLGIGVIAEGIETESQLALLREFKCDFGQGFLFAKPFDLENFRSFISHYKPL